MPLMTHKSLVIKLIVIIVSWAEAGTSLSATSIIPVDNTSSVATNTAIGTVAVPIARSITRARTATKDAPSSTALEATAAVTVGIALTPLLTSFDGSAEGLHSNRLC